MGELRKPSLSDWWQDRLNEAMEKHYPEIIGYWSLVDAWKVDGYNDGTTTLYGVYQRGVNYRLCTFPDYGESKTYPVHPKFEHTGWENPIELEEPTSSILEQVQKEDQSDGA